MYPSSEKSVPKISSSWALEGTISNKHSPALQSSL